MAEINEEKNVETEVTTATKRGPKAASANNDAKVAELNKQLEDMQAAFAKQNEQVQMLLNMMSMMGGSVVNKNGNSALTDEVKIVNLVQRAQGLATYIKLSNLEIAMTDFGEERIVTVQQFEEMVSKYRNWFNTGMISVAAGYEKVAERYGLKTAKDYPIDSDFIRELGDMPMNKIEEVYPKLPESGKDFILGLWNRKVIEGDPKFRDIRKIETLNRLSDGALDQVIVELKQKK